MISNGCDVIFITVCSISHLLHDDKHSLDAGHQLCSREECCSLLYSIQGYVKLQNEICDIIQFKYEEISMR